MSDNSLLRSRFNTVSSLSQVSERDRRRPSSISALSARATDWSRVSFCFLVASMKRVFISDIAAWTFPSSPFSRVISDCALERAVFWSTEI